MYRELMASKLLSAPRIPARRRATGITVLVPACVTGSSPGCVGSLRAAPGKVQFRNVSIDNVFLGCEGTEPCYYAGNRGEMTRGWCGVAPESCVSPGGRVQRRDTGGIVDEPDKGSADCAGLDEGLAVGTMTARGLLRELQTN